MKFVKTTERLPGKHGEYFARYSNNRNDGYDRFILFYDLKNQYIEGDNLEWLDESPTQSQGEEANKLTAIQKLELGWPAEKEEVNEAIKLKTVEEAFAFHHGIAWFKRRLYANCPTPTTQSEGEEGDTMEPITHDENRLIQAHKQIQALQSSNDKLVDGINKIWDETMNTRSDKDCLFNIQQICKALSSIPDNKPGK